MPEASRQLVLRVNQLFHDLEGAEYNHIHPEIFEQEEEHWKELLRTFLKPEGMPRALADIGCGTGFVGRLLAPHLRASDAFHCLDVSATMLDVCEETLKAIPVPCTIHKHKLTDEHLPLADASVGVLTLNSVLHHVPDPNHLLSEIARVLKPGGLLFIGHEPNRQFFQHSFLSNQARTLHKLVPKRVAAAVLQKLGLYGTVVKQKTDPLMDKLNAQLLKEGLITSPLSRHDVSPLIDVHSPTAGGIVRQDEGFDPQHVLDAHPSLKLERVLTYNHLGKMSGTRWLAFYELLLERMYPAAGSTFFLVARKAQ